MHPITGAFCSGSQGEVEQQVIAAHEQAVDDHRAATKGKKLDSYCCVVRTIWRFNDKIQERFVHEL